MKENFSQQECCFWSTQVPTAIIIIMLQLQVQGQLPGKDKCHTLAERWQDCQSVPKKYDSLYNCSNPVHSPQLEYETSRS